MEAAQSSRVAGVDLTGRIGSWVFVEWESGLGLMRVEIVESIALDTDKVVRGRWTSAARRISPWSSTFESGLTLLYRQIVVIVTLP